jgi:hypothetical protein
MEPKQLSEQVNDITNMAVTTARVNLHTELKAIDDRLAKLPVHQHGALLQMLGASYQVRENAMKDAIAEHQHKLAFQREREAQKAQEKLEAQQREIEEANKPKLAVVTQ